MCDGKRSMTEREREKKEREREKKGGFSLFVPLFISEKRD